MAAKNMAMTVPALASLSSGLSRQATRAPTTPLRALVGEVEEASGAATAAHGMKSLFDAIPGIVFYIPVVLIR
jgi:hypothetical protein